MKKKVLLITHMAQMIAQFNSENIDILIDEGIEVHIAANFVSKGNTMSLEALEAFKNKMNAKGVYCHQIDFERGLGSIKGNQLVWKQLNLLYKREKFDLVHCQSPLGGVFGRLVAHKYNVPVIYTSHGFQFFKGGPLKDWLLYYPVERFLSRYTDLLITINKQDEQVAKKFKGVKCLRIPGVGVDIDSLNQIHYSSKLRPSLNIPEDGRVIVSVGELSERKNEQVIIRAVAALHDPNVYYVMVGRGKEEIHLRALAQKLGISEKVIFAGYQSNPQQYYALANIAAFPSRREGLGLAGIEAMATGLPLLTTNVGGISDYSEDSKTGFVSAPDDVDGFAYKIRFLIDHPEEAEKISEYNRKRVAEFSHENVNRIMKDAYNEFLD